jgi:hypothetical protein
MIEEQLRASEKGRAPVFDQPREGGRLLVAGRREFFAPLFPGSRQSECRGVIVAHVALEGFTHVCMCLFVCLFVCMLDSI